MNLKIKHFLYFSFLFICFFTVNNRVLQAQFKGEVEVEEINDSRFKLAQVYYNRGEYASAEQLLLDILPTNNKATICYSLVLVYQAQKKYQSAIDLIENQARLRIANNYALNFQFQSILGQMYWLNSQTQKAEEVWEKVISNNEKQPYVYEFLADVQLKIALTDKAINTLRLSRKNLDIPYIFGDKIVKICISVNDYEQGFKEIINLFEYKGKTDNDYNVFELQTNDLYSQVTPSKTQQSSQSLESYIKANNEKYNLNAVKGRLSSFSQSENCVKYFTAELKKLANNEDRNLFIQDLYAWYLESINSKDLFDVYLRIDKLRGWGGRTIYTLANNARINHNYQLALRAYDYLLDLGKSSGYFPDVMFYKILVNEEIIKNKIDSISRQTTNKEEWEKTKKEEYKKIQQEYRSYLKEYNNSPHAAESYLRIANISVITNELEQAENEYTYIITTYGKSRTKEVYDSYIELSGLFLYKNDLDKAEAKLDDLIKMIGKNKSDILDLTLLKKADILMYRGQIDKADSLYQTLSNSSDKMITNDAIEASFILQKNEDNKANVVKFYQAKLLTKQHKFPEALNTYAQISSGEGEKDIAELALIEAGKLYSSLGEYEKAIETLQKVEQRNIYSQNNDNALLLIAKNQISLNEKDKAIETLKTILNRYPYTIYLQEVRDMILKLREKV